MGFSRQKYWSGLTFPPPGDFPDLALEPGPPAAIALEGDFITIKPPGKPWKTEHKVQMEDLKNILIPVSCFLPPSFLPVSLPSQFALRSGESLSFLMGKVIMWMILWTALSPPDSQTEILTPRTSDLTVFGDRIFKEMIEVT